MAALAGHLQRCGRRRAGDPIVFFSLLAFLLWCVTVGTRMLLTRPPGRQAPELDILENQSGSARQEDRTEHFVTPMDPPSTTCRVEESR
jgi:hypothetical protein